MPELNRRSFLGSAAALTLAAPGFARAQTGAPARGGVLKVSIDQAAAVINPLMTRVGSEYITTEMLYSNLTQLNLDMTPAPDLALSWEAGDDLTEWTFRLREGVTFHDGQPLTADDVVATFEAILNPDNASPGRNNISFVQAVAAKDDLTVVFTLTGPYADFPVSVAYTNARI
ncbi:MAG: ABC transporter substrate-binding protein, partial [Pikeienuella sp.]